MGKLCQLVGTDDNTEISKLHENLARSYEYLSQHALYGTDSAYSSKVDDIRRRLIDVSLGSIVNQVDAKIQIKANADSSSDTSAKPDPSIANTLDSVTATGYIAPSVPYLGADSPDDSVSDPAINPSKNSLTSATPEGSNLGSGTGTGPAPLNKPVSDSTDHDSNIGALGSRASSAI